MARMHKVPDLFAPGALKVEAVWEPGDGITHMRFMYAAESASCTEPMMEKNLRGDREHPQGDRGEGRGVVPWLAGPARGGGLPRRPPAGELRAVGSSRSRQRRRRRQSIFGQIACARSVRGGQCEVERAPFADAALRPRFFPHVPRRCTSRCRARGRALSGSSCRRPARSGRRSPGASPAQSQARYRRRRTERHLRAAPRGCGCGLLLG